MKLAADKRALEKFVVENSELEQLEGLIAQFNIFEAIGVVRQELRHSDFLAFLLDPKQNHGLGDLVVRRLLQRALVSHSSFDLNLSPVHLDVWDLGQMAVRREWEHIDLLLVDKLNRLVVLVENKVDSTEHSGQLEKYLSVVEREFPPSIWKVLAIYLAPSGDSASTDRYVPVSYGLVAEVVESIVATRGASLDPAVTSLLSHYARMLRRHIVADSEIADLCRSIYQRHQRALDLIFEHRPDHLSAIQALLVEHITANDDLVLDSASKQGVRFAPRAWESIPKGSGWYPSGRIPMFEITLTSERVNMALYIGPGPSEVRSTLIKIATERQPPFKVAKGTAAAQKWRQVYSRRILTKDELDFLSREELEGRFKTVWSDFVDNTLRSLIDPIADATDVVCQLVSANHMS